MRTLLKQKSPLLAAAVEDLVISFDEATAALDLSPAEQKTLVATTRGEHDRILRQVEADLRRQHPPSTPPDRRQLKHRFRLLAASVADLRNRLKPASINSIITEPPDTKNDFLPFAELARTAAAVLKPGGSCLVMVNQARLPRILEAMAPHLHYRWMLAHLTTGNQVLPFRCRQVNQIWRPVLWFVNGTNGIPGPAIDDVLKGKANDPRHLEATIADLVAHFTVANETILDPFMRNDTVARMTLKAGRRFIGVVREAKRGNRG